MAIELLAELKRPTWHWRLASAIAPDTDSVAPALTVALNKNVFFYSMKIK